MELSDRVERLEAELKLAKLEDKLVAAKEEGKLTDKLKLQVREARREFRLKYREQVAVQPGTVSATGEVQEAGAG